MHITKQSARAAVAALIGAAVLTACGAAPALQTLPVMPAITPVVTVAPAQAVLPIAATAVPVSPVGEEFAQVSGTGTVKAARTVELSFLPPGRVEQVFVSEGQMVTAGQLLATLDPRPFDALIVQAEADLAAARAAQSALSEAPNRADVQFADANVRQAQIQVARAHNRDEQGVTAATAGVQEAQGNLQATRDELSRQKTDAELRLNQASQLLVQTQAAYAQAKSEWEYVQATGRAPQIPDAQVDLDTKVPQVGKIPVEGDVSAGPLSDVAIQGYYNRYVTAEAAMRQAEAAVQQAQVDYDTARQHEVTGIQNAEQGVAQADAALKLAQVPDDQSQTAAANAALDAAQAARNRLNPAPRPSEKEIAAANVRRAEAALLEAQLNREYAELRAPFDGMIIALNINPGEVAGPLQQPATQVQVPSLQPALTIIDTSAPRFEVPVDEADIGRISLGQQAQIVLDALPGKTFSGTVSYIAPTAQQEMNVRTYLVRIEIDAPENVRDGMSGQVYLKMKDE